MAVKVWYTKGLSVTRAAIAMMRLDPAATGISFMASHSDPANPVREVVDTFVVEPAGLEGDERAGWMLATARAEGVELIVVQSFSDAVSRNRARFETDGIRLQITARPDIRSLLDDKVVFQSDISTEAISAAGVMGHAFYPFTTLADFDAAWDAAEPRSPDGLCAKPAQGIFGAGFRRIDEYGDELARILSTDPGAAARVPLAIYRAALASAAKPVPQLLMPYLPGVERSVDFVAQKGRVLCAVTRVKIGPAQRIEAGGASEGMARVLADRYKLDGVCNLQTREDADGVARILEINPRMSGGLPLACLAGVNLPLMAVLAGLGHEVPVSLPTAGSLVRFDHVACVVDH